MYGPIYRGKSDLSQKEFELLEKKLLEMNSILIYCYDNENNIAKRFKEEDEEFASEDKIKRTLELYQQEIKKSRLPKYKHKMKGKMDLTKDKKIDKIIKKWKFIGE